VLVAEDSTGSCSANGSGRASLPNEWLIAPTPVARGIGRYDGIEVLPDGRTLVSAWNDSTVSEVVGSEVRPLIRGVPTAADIGVDPEAGWEVSTAFDTAPAG
jgi:hypothetical protein